MKNNAYLGAALVLGTLSMGGGRLSAIDFSVRFTPQVSIPIASEGPSDYSMGAGGTLVGDFEVFRGLSPLAEAGVAFMPLRGTDELMNLTSGGIGAGFAFNPIPRLKLRAAGAGGLFNASALDGYRYGVYWTARTDAGYRFSPTFSLLASASYSSYLNSPSPDDALLNSLSFGLSVDIALGSASSRSVGISVLAEQGAPVFPFRYYAYSAEPIGSIKLTNSESAEIRDLEIRFRSEGLTSASILCGSFKIVQRGASVEVPLLASFGERVLDFTESTKAQGEILIAYRLLDTRIERSFTTAVAFNHRNAMTWKNPRAVAAFASPNDAAVLDLSKFVAGLVRERIRPDIDHALQYGIGLFEGLRLTGLSYAEDPSSRYVDFRSDPSRSDYVQYPYQTFAYKGGDSDDLSVLYVTALASVGLQTALIPLPAKVYAAFALDSGIEEARRFFSDPSLFAWRDGKAWVVVDTTKLREGFLPAWRAGTDAWNEAAAKGRDGAFFAMADAWKEFKPVGIGGAEMKVAKPREDRLELAFENVVGKFVASEIAPRVDRVKSEMGNSGGSFRQWNSLGILYARYGLFAEAKAAFASAVAKGSRPAMVNLANVLFLLKDFAGAAKLYADILEQEPANKGAILGLARARYELDAYAEADELFAQVNRLDPELAARYSYLSSTVVGSSAFRASAAADRGGSTPWQEAE